MGKFYWDEYANLYEDIGYRMRDRDGTVLITIAPSNNKNANNLEAELRATIIDDTMHLSTYKPGMKNLIIDIDRLVPAILKLIETFKEEKK